MVYPTHILAILYWMFPFPGACQQKNLKHRHDLALPKSYSRGARRIDHSLSLRRAGKHATHTKEICKSSKSLQIHKLWSSLCHRQRANRGEHEVRSNFNLSILKILFSADFFCHIHRQDLQNEFPLSLVYA